MQNCTGFSNSSPIHLFNCRSLHCLPTALRTCHIRTKPCIQRLVVQKAWREARGPGEPPVPPKEGRQRSALMQHLLHASSGNKVERLHNDRQTIGRCSPSVDQKPHLSGGGDDGGGSSGPLQEEQTIFLEEHSSSKEDVIILDVSGAFRLSQHQKYSV